MVGSRQPSSLGMADGGIAYFPALNIGGHCCLYITEQLPHLHRRIQTTILIIPFNSVIMGNRMSLLRMGTHPQGGDTHGESSYTKI